MEEVTYKTHCKGHDHRAEARRREAEKEAEAKEDRVKMELDQEVGGSNKAKLASSSGVRRKEV